MYFTCPTKKHDDRNGNETALRQDYKKYNEITTSAGGSLNMSN